MKSVSPVKRASHVSHAKAAVKVAVNAVVVATNAVTKHQRQTLPKPRLPMAMHPTSVPNALNALNALNRQSQQTLHHKATSPLLAKTRPKNARPANVAAVTVMAASVVNAVSAMSKLQKAALRRFALKHSSLQRKIRLQRNRSKHQ